MSSTVIVSSFIAGAPTSLLDEDVRSQKNESASQPGQESTIQTIQGTITDVHDSAPLIKAHTNIGAAIAGGQWIPLEHSLSDIVERFGKLRKGLKVRVSYTGVDGLNASASIVGLEGESSGEGTLIENKIQIGLFAIFTPGSC